MSKKIKVSKVGQSDVYVPAYDSDGKTLTVESVVGPGAVPLGGMVAVMPHVDAAAWQPPLSGAIKDGFMRADGTVITSTHVSQGCKFSAGATLPSMMAKYPRGNTTSGTTGGANTVTIASANLPTHTHGSGTLANAAEAAHTHGVGTYGNTAEAAHTHNWGGNWSNDNATYYTAPYGDGSQNTYSDGIAGINAWGSGSYASINTATANPYPFMRAVDTVATIWGGETNHCAGRSGGGFVDYYDQALYPYQNHTHTYYLPSHRHWIQIRTSAAGSSHNHTFSGTSAAGSSHNHVISGSTDNGGFANTALNNEPAYVEVIWVIRVK